MKTLFSPYQDIVHTAGEIKAGDRTLIAVSANRIDNEKLGQSSTSKPFVFFLCFYVFIIFIGLEL